ncbi:MAG TPA: S9 family peptidase [Gemmatimonadaceae bacterium]|nr:S9 family peptidase [Gemmatimonadaceae bacterium]
MKRVVFYVVALPIALHAQDARRPVTLDDYYRLEQVSSPAISPDGKWVAFVRTTIVEQENRRHSEVWLAAADGSQPPRRITQPGFSASDPRWSPDGSLLAFSSRRRAAPQSGSESSVWFLRVDGGLGEAFQIPGVSEMPIFSPDNQWIAFARATPPPAPNAAPLSDTERKIAERFTGKAVEWLSYRFDGRGYLPDPTDPRATPPRELYVVARSGGTPRRLTSLGIDVSGIAWSPDSRRIAFVADSGQRDEYVYERADLFVSTLDGGLQRLTNDGYDHDSPVWTPDGRFIVLRRQQGLSAVIASRQPHGAPTDLYRISASGGHLENLTARWDLLPGAPRMAPDGAHVEFEAGLGGESHIFRLALNGNAISQVTKGARRIGGVSTTAKHDRIAYVGTDPTHPGEVFVANADGSAERRLTSFNGEFVGSRILQPAVRVEYPSKDGTRIEGWLIMPPRADSMRPVPLILAIHGGPHGAYGTDFNFQFQLWASNGYAVLYTNPRGSTGYGEQFLWATWGGGWGIKDYDDVMAGVDHVAKLRPIDTKRLGVTGYSYGGFLTNWVITQTPRFAAAISGAGISNWISDYATADIPRTKESEFFGAPWEPEARKLLERQSPIYYAGKVVTPTMFIHGEADLRVPIEQAEQMYIALKKRKVPARFVRYPDMYHGGWTPWNTVHRYNEELKWWARHFGQNVAQ